MEEKKKIVFEEIPSNAITASVAYDDLPEEVQRIVNEYAHYDVEGYASTVLSVQIGFYGDSKIPKPSIMIEDYFITSDLPHITQVPFIADWITEEILDGIIHASHDCIANLDEYFRKNNVSE